MNFEEFETKARLYVLGALEEEDLADFEGARVDLGPRAEEVLDECHRLNAAFVLTLRPTPPRPATKERLLSMISSALGRKKDETV